MTQDPGPPPLIPAENIHVERRVDPLTKQVSTHYLNSAGQEILPAIYHLSKDAASFDPPPGSVIVEEAEAILAEEVSDS